MKIPTRLATTSIATALIITLTPLTALAQTASSADGGGGGETSITWFHMFFVADGLAQVALLVLLALSAFSIGHMIHLAVQYRRSTLLPAESMRELSQMLAMHQVARAAAFADKDGSFLGRLMSSALREARHGHAAMQRAIENTGDVETGRILRLVEYLNVIGSVAPMIGLFGTVYGIIEAFRELVQAGGGSPAVGHLAGGISTALVTTFWGLFVAIPALSAYALIRNRVDALTSEGMLMAEQMIEPFKPAPATPTAALGDFDPALAPAGHTVSTPMSATPRPVPQPVKTEDGPGHSSKHTSTGTTFDETRSPLPDRRFEPTSD